MQTPLRAGLPRQKPHAEASSDLPALKGLLNVQLTARHKALPSLLATTTFWSHLQLSNGDEFGIQA